MSSTLELSALARSTVVYRVNNIVFKGDHPISDADLRSQMTTKVRPFYLIWHKRPAFDHVKSSLKPALNSVWVSNIG